MGLFKAHWLSRPWLWELNKESPKYLIAPAKRIIQAVWKETSARVKLEEKENIHHSSRTCLVSQRMSSQGSGWQPGAAAAQTCSRRKQAIQYSDTASSSGWCCAVSHAHHSSHQLGQTAFSGSPSCHMSHSLIDIRNLNGLILWKLIVYWTEPDLTILALNSSTKITVYC